MPELPDLLAALRGFLDLPDERHVVFALAVAVSSEFDELSPLWGLLIGPAGGGKSETIRLLDSVTDERVGELTAAGLISWRSGRQPRPTGLLARVGPRAFVSISDLSAVLSQSDRGSRDLLFSLLRGAYDGEVVRELGSAPEPLRWRGRLTMLAAVTPAVDAFSAHADALGPRWLYCRLPERDTAARRAMSQRAHEHVNTLAEHRRVARKLTAEVVATAVKRAPDVALSAFVRDALEDAALVAALGRAAVARDGYGRREIVGLASVEEPGRLVGQLAQLAKAASALGLADAAVIDLCRRCALDSTPQARRRVLVALAPGEELTAAEIGRRVRADRKVVRFALEELAAVGVVRYRGDEHDDEPTRTAKPWRLDGPDAALIARVVTEGETKKGSPPPIPPRNLHASSHTNGSPLHGSSHAVEADRLALRLAQEARAE
jgi:hypothetical protein